MQQALISPKETMLGLLKRLNALGKTETEKQLLNTRFHGTTDTKYTKEAEKYKQQVERLKEDLEKANPLSDQL